MGIASASIATSPTLGSFEEFYRREFPRLAGSLRIVCGDFDLAEELAQEAFARALNHWDRLASFERPAGWLYRTGFNLLRRHWRRARRGDGPLVNDTYVPDPGAERIDLVRLLAQLPFQQRQAVVLRHVLDYSTDEAAELLETSPGALRMTLHRAVTALREKSDLHLDDEENVQ